MSLDFSFELQREEVRQVFALGWDVRTSLDNWDGKNLEQVWATTEKICLNTDSVFALVKSVCLSLEEGHESFDRIEKEYREQDMVGSIFFNKAELEITAYCVMSPTTFNLLRQTLEYPATIEAVTDELERRECMERCWVGNQRAKEADPDASNFLFLL